MNFYNHFDLAAISDDFVSPSDLPSYEAVFDCGIEMVSNTHFSIFTKEAFFNPSDFSNAFDQIYGVNYSRLRTNFEMDVYLKFPTFHPSNFIQDLQRVFDEVMKLQNENIMFYTIPPLNPKPVKKAIESAKEILNNKGLVAEEKTLYNYYRKIKRNIGHCQPHPFYAGCRIVDMVEANGDARKKPRA